MADHSQLRQASRAAETIEVVERNWRAEVETAQVYRELAARETDENAVVVDIGFGNDSRRRDRSGGHLRTRTGLWRD